VEQIIMKKSFPSVAFSILLINCTPAAASTANFGKITALYTVRSGYMFVEMNGTRTTVPTCATLTRWVINLSSAGGQTIASSILSAQAQGRQISIIGTGDCTDWFDSESIDNLSISVN
jgi:hypothetical protein